MDSYEKEIDKYPNMDEIKYIKPSKGYNLCVKYISKNIQLKIKGCKLVNGLYEMKDNIYYITVKYPDDYYYKWLRDFETKTYKEVKNWRPMIEYMRTFNSDKLAQIKVPFRYKRFEIQVFDKDKDRVTAYELKKDREVDITIELLNIWSLDSISGAIWVLKEAYLYNDSIILNEE